MWIIVSRAEEYAVCFAMTAAMSIVQYLLSTLLMVVSLRRHDFGHGPPNFVNIVVYGSM